MSKSFVYYTVHRKSLKVVPLEGKQVLSQASLLVDNLILKASEHCLSYRQGYMHTFFLLHTIASGITWLHSVLKTHRSRYRLYGHRGDGATYFQYPTYTGDFEI